MINDMTEVIPTVLVYPSEKAAKEAHDRIVQSLRDICPVCFGSGKVKAMQMANTFNGPSIRVEDVSVTCATCGGRGMLKEGDSHE